MTEFTWRSINPEDTPVLWPALFVSSWFFGPGLVIGAGREMTLNTNTSMLNVLLVVIGVLATTLAVALLINARRSAGIGIDGQHRTSGNS